jgi:hypothetical protein
LPATFCIILRILLVDGLLYIIKDTVLFISFTKIIGL